MTDRDGDVLAGRYELVDCPSCHRPVPSSLIDQSAHAHKFVPLPRDVTFGTKSVIYCQTCGEFRVRLEPLTRGTIVND